jgi:O-antigen/teichoic acid export membrane protein
MLRQLFGHAALYTAGSLAARLIGLGTILVLSRRLSPAEFGLLDLANAAAVLLNLGLCLEVSQGLGRRFADRGTADSLIGYTSTAFIFSLVMALGCTASILLFPEPWARLVFADGSRMLEMRAAALVVLGTILVYGLTRQARWELRPRLAVSMQLVQGSAALVLSAAAVIGFGFGVSAVLLAQAAAAGLAALLGLAGLRRSLRPVASLAALKEMLGFSLPLVPAGAAALVIAYADRYCLSHFGGLDYVGGYAVAMRIGNVILLVIIGVQTAFLPLMVKQVEQAGTAQAIADAFRVIVLLALGGVLTLGLFAPEITGLIAGPRFAGSAGLVPWLAAGTLLGELYVFAPGLFLKRRTGWLLGINLVAATVNILLNLLLIPRLGPLGSALALVASTGLSFAATMVLSQRLLPVPIGWTRLGAAAGLAVAALIAGALWPGLAVRAGLLLLSGLVLPALLIRPAEGRAWAGIVMTWVRNTRSFQGRRARTSR